MNDPESKNEEESSFSFGLQARFIFEDGKYAIGALITLNGEPLKLIGFTNVKITDGLMTGKTESKT